jgi:hypothetical protein
MEELKEYYRPFTETIPPPAATRTRGSHLNPWSFRYRGQEEWEEITLPEYKGETFWEGEYRTTFEVPGSVSVHPRIVVYFGGVETRVVARLNGATVGTHSGGSDPFGFDVTGAVKRKGENLLELSVANGLAPNGVEYARAFSRMPYLKAGQFYKLVGEWGNMNGREGRAGGVWRPVMLEGTSEAWVDHALIEPDPESERVVVKVEVGSIKAGEGELMVEILPKNFPGKTVSSAAPLPFEEGRTFQAFTLQIPQQRWWSQEEPYLYIARISLTVGGKLADSRDFTFGQRTFRYDESLRRYRFNGKPFRFLGSSTINSLNMALLRGDVEGVVKQILLTKAADFNMLRHHIMSPIAELNEYFDMYGMLSQPEMPIWGRFFPELVETAIDELPRIVRQHYNHPSTVLFAISSESPHREGYADYQRRAIEIMERDFPLLEWKVEGVRGNTGGPTAPRSEAGDLFEYKPDLFDLHEYTGWYVNLGSLEPVRDGQTLMTIGEFGAESLSNFSSMEATWPEGSFPADLDAQVTRDELPFGPQYSWAESRWFLPTPRTLRGWIEETQNHSAFVHRYRTDILRRSSAVLGYHQYFINEPVWNTWRKTLCGADLSPKEPYFVMAEANKPVRVSLFSDRDHFLPGEAVRPRLFLINDSLEDIEAADIRVFLLAPSGEIIEEKSLRASAAMGGPIELEGMEWILPKAGDGTYFLKAYATAGSRTLADDSWEFRVLNPSEWPLEGPSTDVQVIHFAGTPDSQKAGRRIEESNSGYLMVPLAEIHQHLGKMAGKLVVIDGCADWARVPTSLLAAEVRAGGRLLVAESEPGDLPWIHPELSIVADPLRALFRIDVHHPIFEELRPEETRLWNFVPTKRPLAARPIDPYLSKRRSRPADASQATHPYIGKRTRDLVDCPILFGGREFNRMIHRSRDGRFSLYSIADADRSASSLLEIEWESGRILLSQARLFERYFTHPLARALFHRQIDYLAGEMEEASREKFDLLNWIYG